MKTIKTVGIVGFGVMGSAIGLNAAAAGYNVVFRELNDDLVKAMYERFVLKALGQRVEKGKMTQAQMDAVRGRICGTSRLEDLKGCDLIIEAAIEKMDLKIQLFGQLSAICPPDTIIVSNTSTFLIEKLMEKVVNPSRTAGLHYFFPANVNRLVEVIRQKQTSDATYDALMTFARQNGKVAISVRDFPGFAINPVFISSYMVLDSFLSPQCNVATLEAASQQALGVRFGIMWVQNGSGLGTCYHAAASMADYLRNSDTGYPALPPQLKVQFDSGNPWNLQDGPISSDPALIETVKQRLLGAIFAISTHLIEKQVVSVADLELGITTALAWPKGPFALMNGMGMDKAAGLVAKAVAAGDFKMPERFAAGDLTPWPL
jgi:3-hydroxyacyl-CoA dehydrogenase